MTRQELAIGTEDRQSDLARRLSGLVLVRIATGGGTDAEIAKDLLPIVPNRQSPDIWRIELGRLISALQAGGLVTQRGRTLAASEEGMAAAQEFLRCGKSFPSSWANARDRALLALALGLEKAPATRLKLLGKADGLRALVVIQHWKLAIRGVPSPSRIRSALAVKALERAFGNKIRNGLGDKSTLPAKASRLLAGQLAAEARDFGTDARLVAALAAEAMGVRRADLKTLQTAALRRYFDDVDTLASPAPRKRTAKNRKRLATSPIDQSAAGTAYSSLTPTRPSDAAAAVVTPLPEVRPDPEGFARSVNTAAEAVADGWAGNRKAFISKVWSELQQRHAAWALTEIEFKCMLAEAHRTGLVVLANADLKDKRFMKEFQDSAVIYKNTVWHYVRVQD